MKNYVIGIDYGTDSARAVLVDCSNGQTLSSSVECYPRWAKGLYCDAPTQQFRQHPLDYLECLEKVLSSVISECPDPSAIRAISVDTTGSTPCFVGADARPLSLLEEFSQDPDAMFVLWKDHSAAKESELITRLCAEHEPNYACHTGNDYSPECFWTKVLHILRTNPKVRDAAVSVIEECDFITATLTGVKDYRDIKPGHCAAGAKHLWAQEWGGFPPEEFFRSVDPILLPILHNLNSDNRTCDQVAGHLCPQWAEILGLSTDVVIGYGNIDSHSGAVGAGITDGTIVMNIGTSACYMAVVPKEKLGGRIIDGVFGQVDDGILPGMVGFEAGLSAFGDAFAWLKKTLCWPMASLAASPDCTPEMEAVLKKAQDELLVRLTEQAQALPLSLDAPLATDHLNGRRTPSPDGSLSAGFAGLRITTSAPELFRAIVEAVCFASRRVIDYLEENGVDCSRLVAVGGISQKSPYVMQTLADVMGRRVEVSACKDSCAMGAAVYASVAGGVWPDVVTAQKNMCALSAREYTPDESKKEIYDQRYARYKALVTFCEQL
ncbi:MAG: ribulokinase [Bacteroidales bacterium]|nr:ribulokinase [Bacteroidales bacterium]